MLPAIQGTNSANAARNITPVQSPQGNSADNSAPLGSGDFLSKVTSIVARAVAVYPTASMAAQIKGGASYSDASKHMLDKIRHFPNPRSGSAAYVGASTVSLVPATLADPLKRTLVEQGVESPMADKLALGVSALATGITTNFRNLAFTDGKHGLDGTKIFRPVPLAASFMRDTLTGLVYAKALQARPNETRIEKVQHAAQAGVPVGGATSILDVIAYVAAKEKIDLKVLLSRTLRVAPIRGFNVALGAGIMAAFTPENRPSSGDVSQENKIGRPNIPRK